MSKGSTPRPFSVERAEYERRWERVFGAERPVQKERKDAFELIWVGFREQHPHVGPGESE